MQRLRAWAAGHPRVVDAGLAGVVAVLALPATASQGAVSGACWLGYAAIPVPLVWRRRMPVLMFWVSYGLLGASDLLGVTGPIQILVPLVALYAVARHRPQLYLWPAAAAMELSVVLTWLTNDRQGPLLISGTALIAATALLGITTRTRRAYLAQLEERAERLERERDQQAQLAVAAERSRIAREMHDIVAHNLAVMVALADGAAFTTTADPQRAAETMQQVSGTGRQALSEMRRLVGLLRGGGPAADLESREPQPGLDDIDQLLAHVRAAGMRVALTREGLPGEWGPGAGLAVYRIVQEALTNTLKHAGPRASAEVRLRYAPGRAEVEVLDDGAGRSTRAVEPGGRHGLAGMAERAAFYGGRVEAGPRPGAGWRVHAYLCFAGGVDG